ncbi:MAG: amino acid dehydrogenase [Planctomyces sp.]|nr:amino acid dehydrogenase [Planctomyces sp.]
MAADVVIIGGGVVGAMCARYLAKTGRSVTLVEQGTMGSLCSKGNCGYVSPSHVLPLAEPGVLFKTLKSMTTPNSPFHIRPRFDLALLGWLTNFARKCNEKDMMAAGTALNAILRSSFDEYKKVIAEDYLDCEWQHEGILFVYRKASEFEAFCKTDDMLAEKFDRPARRIVGDDALIEFEPALKPGNTGAFLYDCDAHLRPDKLMEQMRASLVSQGVTLLEGTKVEEIVTEGSRFKAVKTSQGEIEAGHVVVAAGALSPLFQKALRCKIPVQPGKGLSITMKRPKICPKIPMIFHDHRVAITPFQTGYRIGSTMEFAGYDTTINPQRLSLLTEGAKLYLHDPVGEPEEEPWFGWRPMTYDSVPIIGPAPGVQGAWLATGHSMLGISLATSTGKLISEMINGEKPHIDPQPYAVTRF